MLTSTRSPSTRRSAPLLAGVLMTLQVLTGLIICAGPGGASTSWDANSECPRRALKKSTVQVEDVVVVPDAGACVTLSSDEALAAAGNADAAAALHVSGLLPAPAGAERVASAPVQRSGTLRGPPLEVSRSIRSVVLRI